MQQSVDGIWSKENTTQLADALCAITDAQTMQRFLSDVMTETEITEISSRLQVAQMLQDGATYADIIAKTQLSSRTVARISSWLQNGTGGYAVALDIVNAHHTHTPPARA